MSETVIFPKNPSLEPLSILIGKWRVTMTHNALPHPLTWEDTIEWLENSFIMWHWQGKNEVPKAELIINRNENNPSGSYKMFYYDSRGVSRTFEMTLDKNTWKFWREDADFFQRFTGSFSEDGNVITGKGENSYNKGESWEHDYDISYIKI